VVHLFLTFCVAVLALVALDAALPRR